MNRLILNSILISLLLFGCKNTVGPFSCDSDAPDWLITKLESETQSYDYFGTKVYRYEWKGESVYHIEVSISSCAFCELYDENGDPMVFADEEEFHDFHEVTEDGDEVCVWSG